MMAAMVSEMAAAKPTLRRHRETTPIDPWEGVRSFSVAESEALAELGWSAWPTVRERTVSAVFPPQFSKSGPQTPDVDKVRRGLVTAEGMANWQARAIVCAKLAQYGKLHVGHLALILTSTGANGTWVSDVGKFVTSMQQTLKTKVTRTEDGYIMATPNGRQAMHDQLVKMADYIITGK
jgi:hypothetical protein